MQYFLGLDNGGTTTKAAIYDLQGREMGVSSMETKMLTPRPGFIERDMEEMWEANCAVIRGVLEKTGILPGDVAGVAVCGHGKGLSVGKRRQTGAQRHHFHGQPRLADIPERGNVSRRN